MEFLHLKIALSPTGSGKHVTFLFISGIFEISKKSLHIIEKSQRSSDLPIT